MTSLMTVQPSHFVMSFGCRGRLCNDSNTRAHTWYTHIPAIFGLDKLLPHFAAFPLILAGLNLAWVLIPAVWIVLLLPLLSHPNTHPDKMINICSIIPLTHSAPSLTLPFIYKCSLSELSCIAGWTLWPVCELCGDLTLCLRFSFMMSLVSCNIFSFQRSKK